MARRADPPGPGAGDPIAAFLAAEADRGSWPGAVWRVEEGGRVVSAGAVGSRSLLPERLPADEGTIYDLASLTKPLATAALLAMLQEEGRLDLDDPAERHLPGLACASGGRPTLRDLALHRSGLPAWRPFYLDARTPGEVIDRVAALPAEAPAGSRVVYSDPGYILLGEVLRVASGARGIADLFAEQIAKPLGLEALGFRPPTKHPLDRIAPTEEGNRHERELAERPRASSPERTRTYDSCGPAMDPGGTSRFRTELIHGEVHDGNAHALGGAAGHAGLFGTAGEVARLAREFFPAAAPRRESEGVTGLEESRAAGKGAKSHSAEASPVFSTRALTLFRENGTPGLEEARSVGWKLAEAGCREAAGVLPPESFGHTGFTGTSLFVDPVSGRIYVLLTNRVHPRVRPIDMNALRRRFHEIASRLP